MIRKLINKTLCYYFGCKESKKEDLFQKAESKGGVIIVTYKRVTQCKWCKTKYEMLTDRVFDQ